MPKWCAVVGCQYSSKKLNEFLKQPCFVHKGLSRQGCSCEKPYMFFPLPSNTDRQREWKAALKLKNPPKADNFYVCSFHFVNKRPTVANPTPELFLGYEKKLNTRRLLKRDASCCGQPQKTQKKTKQLKIAETSHLREEIQEAHETNEDPALEGQTNEDPDIKVETTEDPDIQVETAEDPDIKVETTEDPDIKVETTEDPDIKVETTEDPDIKVETTEDPDIKVETTEDPDIKVETTEDPDIKVETTEDPDIKVETTEDPDIKVETTEDPDIKVETTEDPDIKVETTEDPDIKVETAEDPDIKVQTTEDPYIKVETTEDPDIKVETTEDPDIKVETTEDPDIKVETTEDPDIKVETTEDPDIKVETTEELFPQSKGTVVNSMDASTQWVDSKIISHKYACVRAALLTDNVSTQTEVIACSSVAVQFDGPINAFETIIQNDADSRFFTGIPETALLTLIKRMEPYALSSFQMNISDQILMTLMKLKLNLMLYDISRRFSVSQSLVSRTLSFWIDTLAEHLAFNQEDIKLTRKNGCVHADRTSKRMQAFKILSHKVPTTLDPKMSKIILICGALVTMMPDVMKDDTE